MRKPIKTLGRVLFACIAGLMLIALISIISSLHAPAHAQEWSPQKPTMDTRVAHQEFDRVIAVVNQEVITQQELNAHIRLIQYRMKQHKQPATDLPPPEVFQRQVLDHMIVQRIQLQAAREQGIGSEDKTVSLALEKMAQDQHLSLPAYRQALQNAGIPWLIVQQVMKSELTIEALRQKEVDQKVTVSNAEIDQYLANPSAQAELAQLAAQAPAALSTEQVHIRHILIRVDHSTSEKQAQQKLLDIRKKILAGTDFGTLARTFSQDGSAAQGGDLGWIYLRDTVPEFAQAASALAINTLSFPVHTEYGYHLIEVIGRRAPDAKHSAEAQQRNLARQFIGMRKAARAYQAWLRTLHDSATIQYKLSAVTP